MQPRTDAPWLGLRPEEVASDLSAAAGAWWICGGWAIDLWAGGQTRAHADTDVGCFRDDLPRLCTTLEDWEFFEATDGILRPLGNQTADSSVNSLWCRRRGSEHWSLQIMIETRRGDRWVFRRDQRIQLPVWELTWTAEVGVAVLKPEVQLLYKAKDVRTRDQEDFEVLRGRLSRDAVQWLVQSLALIHPGHRWLRDLNVGSGA
jgi:hypothetical protein